MCQIVSYREDVINVMHACISIGKVVFAGKISEVPMHILEESFQSEGKQRLGGF